MRIRVLLIAAGVASLSISALLADRPAPEAVAKSVLDRTRGENTGYYLDPYVFCAEGTAWSAPTTNPPMVGVGATLNCTGANQPCVNCDPNPSGSTVANGPPGYRVVITGSVDCTQSDAYYGKCMMSGDDGGLLCVTSPKSSGKCSSLPDQTSGQSLQTGPAVGNLSGKMTTEAGITR